jgi:hypothetical protein
MKLRRLFVDGVLLAAAFAVLAAMRASTPNYTRLLAPIDSHGARGELVRGRSLALRVEGVDVARRLRVPAPGGARELDSSGLWLIVHASAQAVERPERVAGAAIATADGRRYAHSDRAGYARALLAAQELQAGVPARGDLVFELPQDALADARLVASAHPLDLAPLDSRLDVGLGLDAATLAAAISAMRDVYDLERP